MLINSNHIRIGVFLLLSVFCSCKKYLEKKSVETLSTPQTLDDLQALIDNPIFNLGINITNTSSDEYYVTNNELNGLDELRKDGYIWNGVMNDYADWRDRYNAVFYANSILDNLRSFGKEGDNIKGAALFLRAFCFLQIAQLYAPQYDTSTASSDLGIVLRLNSDFNEPSYRATVQQTYDRIVDDLTEAVELLPISPIYKTRPSKPACYALLARAYLQMGDYQKAREAADACLQVQNSLLDFNTEISNPSSSTPIPRFNKETLFYASTGAPANALSTAKIDSNLYNSFDENDLRKTIYFLPNGNGTYRFKGSYSQALNDLFCGLAIDEVYLIRAEAAARLGNAVPAMQDLNTLLSKRWKAGAFIPLLANSPADALALIIQERKKELIYRALRWPDLKRLNKESQFAATLVRNLNGQIYQLPPNDLRYVLLIPSEVINLTNLSQNKR